MLLRRLQNTTIALLGVVLPFLIASMVMMAIISHRSPPDRPTGSPNPQRAPLWMLWPAGLLVYTDPWWAGTLLPLFTIVVPPVAVFVVLVPFVWPVGAQGQPRRLGLLWAGALMLGIVLAGPWIYGLVRLLWEA